MPKYDDTPCDISELPRYSCYDCVHHLHGRHVDTDTEMLKQTVGPASYSDIVRITPEPVMRVLEAHVDGSCDHPDCPTGKFKATDKIVKTDDFGWVHARHVL